MYTLKIHSMRRNGSAQRHPHYYWTRHQLHVGAANIGQLRIKVNSFIHPQLPNLEDLLGERTDF